MIYNVAYQNEIRDILFSIRRLIQAEEGCNKHLEENYGISASQFLCILALYENGPLPPSQIAKRILVNSSSLTRMIDHLEQKNLVERSRISGDRRIVTISLTEGGKNLAEKAASDMNQAFMMVLCHLNGNEVEQIVRAMKWLTDLIQSQKLRTKKAIAC